MKKRPDGMEGLHPQKKMFNVACKPFPHLFILMLGDASKIKPWLK